MGNTFWDGFDDGFTDGLFGNTYRIQIKDGEYPQGYNTGFAAGIASKPE